MMGIRQMRLVDSATGAGTGAVGTPGVVGATGPETGAVGAGTSATGGAPIRANITLRFAKSKPTYPVASVNTVPALDSPNSMNGRVSANDAASLYT